MILPMLESIQKLLSKGFKQNELNDLIKKQQDFLLKNIDRIPDNEFNAIWDLYWDLQESFKIPNGCVAAVAILPHSITKVKQFKNLSIQNVYNHYLDLRNKKTNFVL